MKPIPYLLIPIFLLSTFSCRQTGTTHANTGVEESITILPDSLGKLFTDFAVRGCFVALNIDSGAWYIFDTAAVNIQSTPASTFKIFNSLVCLETGVLNEISDTLQWDGVPRSIESWNHDQSMHEAFRNSTVWFYQKVAERIGQDRMQYWIDTVGYGNTDISGGITQFWLTGNLGISPQEQVLFLEKLVTDELHFGKAAMSKVREMMILEQDSTYTLGAKTGWGIQDGVDYGWFVGYVLRSDGSRWAFATRIETDKEPGEDFAKARSIIATAMLKHIGALD